MTTVRCPACDRTVELDKVTGEAYALVIAKHDTVAYLRSGMCGASGLTPAAAALLYYRGRRALRGGLR